LLQISVKATTLMTQEGVDSDGVRDMRN